MFFIKLPKVLKIISLSDVFIENYVYNYIEINI